MTTCKAKKVTVFFILLACLIIAALCAFLFFYIDGYSPLLGAKPGVQLANEPVKAFNLSFGQYPANQEQALQQQYLDDAVQFAAANGFNSITFDAQQGDKALFYDELFEKAYIGDEFDPLEYLAKMCLQNKISLFVNLDPYNIPSDSNLAKKYLTQLDGNSQLIANSEYNTALLESVHNLCKKYSVSGISFNECAYDVALSDFALHYAELFNKVPNDVNACLTAKSDSVFLTSDIFEAFDKNCMPDYIFASFNNEQHKDFAAILNNLSALGAKPVAVFSEDNSVYTAELLLNCTQKSFNGAVFNGYTAAQKLPLALRLMLCGMQIPAANQTLPTFISQNPQKLAVTIPTEDTSTYYSTYFITGFILPGQSLTVNDTAVDIAENSSTFGVLVDLALGENSFTFKSGDEEVTVNITRKSYSSGGSGSIKHDGTVFAQPGQAVKITAWIASALSDPDNNDSITATLRQGTVAVVQKTVTTIRSGKYTYAYQLQDGSYVLAYNTEFCLDTPNTFSGFTISEDEHGEYINLTGSGTPLIIPHFENGSLSLDFYNIDFTLNEIPQSKFFTACSLAADEDDANKVTLTFDFAADNPLWGYQIEYTTDGLTKIYLKKQPVLSDDFLQPLKGVTVMLDAGHGGTDTGALGIGGALGLTEKDFNLAIANATQYRLQQLGATVIMTRTDDSFPSLEDRNRMQIEQKPDFFLAIHHNSLEPVKDASSIHRVEAYYFEDTSKSFADNLMNNISFATGRDSTAAAWNYFYVNRVTICPSVLFEYGYLVCPTEYEDCSNNEQIWQAACANAQSIIDSIPQ